MLTSHHIPRHVLTYLQCFIHTLFKLKQCSIVLVFSALSLVDLSHNEGLITWPGLSPFIIQAEATVGCMVKCYHLLWSCFTRFYSECPATGGILHVESVPSPSFLLLLQLISCLAILLPAHLLLWSEGMFTVAVVLILWDGKSVS